MCNENMELYMRFRACPKEAQKPITAGRLKGKTDINPMWRIKMLTEAFGPCGIGWVCPIVDQWIEDSPETNERTANVKVKLRYKYNGEWSEPIDGIGGSMFISQEKNDLYVDDDCFKKAYTDAISVACKSLGLAADVYFAADPDTKYVPKSENEHQSTEDTFICVDCGARIDDDMAHRTFKRFGSTLCKDCGLRRIDVQAAEVN